ncbi:MAG: excinuclease ABC subunit UvrA [Thermodesulfobacteria bacterium]|nr:excinuclease ABC subunit UvrA [Thermodesulfobacteriota bacterium]
MKKLIIRGASQHNLKGLDIEIELGSICAVTGPSGAGKSSLVFDTIYSESQRRFIETFSPYARQFLERLPRARVEDIRNLPAAIGIGQANPVRNSRSTVATLAEISFPARMLFYRCSTPYCQECDRPIRAQGWKDVLSYLEDAARAGARAGYICVKAQGQMLHDMVREGYSRVLADGKAIDVSELGGPLDKECLVVIDRLPVKKLQQQRVKESVEAAFSLGQDTIYVSVDGQGPEAFSKRPMCQVCGKKRSKPTVLLFSFNSPEGACPTCSGFGRVIGVDWNLVVPDASLSLAQGAIRPLENWHEDRELLFDWCKEWGVDLSRPWKELSEDERQWILFGRDEWYGIKGIFDWLETKRYKAHIRILLSRYRAYEVCPSCKGARFNEDALSFRLGGLNIAQFYAMSVNDALEWISGLEVAQVQDRASASLKEDLGRRLALIQRAGLGYLSLDRQSRTLSGGELSRLCLAKGVSVSLSETLFCLEEPSSGLHPRDIRGVRDVIEGLRHQGNTVVMTENDPVMLSCCQRLIELGPGSGREGGQIVSETEGHDGRALGEELPRVLESLPAKVNQETPKGPFIQLEGLRHNNLKGFSCRFPLGQITCVCGVSGSGKSTLVEECLYRGLLRNMGRPSELPGAMEHIEVPSQVKDVVFVDQEPLSRTPRGCPGTYLKVLDHVRKFFASTEEARSLGLKPGYFSLNVDGGRCPECKGQGYELLEMQFLPDVFVPCPSCKGARFSKAALEIEFRGKNISDFLEMTLSEVHSFFEENPSLTRLLEPAIGLGLGHLLLGQPLNTLSSGEAQRLKLAKHLSSRSKGALFILDEPTRGLHQREVQALVREISRLKGAGNTVVVVEHDLFTILSSDWVIELGPEGGEKGGELLFQGPPGKLERQETPTAKAIEHVSCPREVEDARQAKEKIKGQDIKGQDARGGQEQFIRIRGARHHNLKDVGLDIPRNKLVVVTGVSGSGKSSLAFDLVFKEAQRRYLESLPSYMKQFVKLHERAEVDEISGLSPPVAIEQKAVRGSVMSTVATLSEVSHYLRLLYTHCSRPVCPECGGPMKRASKGEIARQVQRLVAEGGPFYLAAPKVRRRKGWHQDEITRGFGQGADFVMVDGRLVSKGEKVHLARHSEHDIYWVWGPFSGKGPGERLNETIERALKAGKGAFCCMFEQGAKRWFSVKYFCQSCGQSVEEPDPLLFSFHTKSGRCQECNGRGRDEHGNPCPVCDGARLTQRALVWRVDSMSIAEFMALEIDEALACLRNWLDRPQIQGLRKELFSTLAKEAVSRLELMSNLGLGYLRLDRSGDTLSGGEAQRISLCAQSGSNLTGITVVLDEPTIGLHPTDNKQLIEALKGIRDKGNSVIVVEHDPETILDSDHVIDLGPGGGKEGGQIVFQGSPQELLNSRSSTTGRALGQKGVVTPVRGERGKKAQELLSFDDITKHNLDSVSVSFPVGCVTVVTGVSGSGKTSLKEAIFERVVALKERGNKWPEGKGISGVLHIDHNPIGRSPRSCPATFLGVFTHIRELFSRTPASRMKGFGPAHFSFNTKEGACPHCSGQGQLKQSLGLLPDVYVKCPVCMGKRFRPDVLTTKWKNRDISEILGMTISEALEFFMAIPAIRGPLKVMEELGLGYLELGQPSPTLSGGEAQRLKIAKEFSKAHAGGKLYLLDEPSVGLHMDDVGRLSRCLSALADKGNTVLMVEHDLSMVAMADWIIDLGPGGGRLGGRVLFQGPLEEFIGKGPATKTRQCLREFLPGRL